MAPKRRSSRSWIWPAVMLFLICGTVLLYLGIHKWRSSPFDAPKEAIGEGESREDFVRVQGTQVTCILNVSIFGMSRRSRLQAIVRYDRHRSCNHFAHIHRLENALWFG